MIDYYTHCTVCKKDIIINYMLIIPFLGGLVIVAKIVVLVKSPRHN